MSSSREKLNTGWCKFSIIDCVRIKAIFDLRKMGCSRKRVGSFMEKLNCGNIGLWGSKENRVLRLTRLGVKDFVIACLFGVKIFLVIRENGEAFFLSETGVRNFYLSSSDKFSPVITLPFFSYVKKTANVMRKQMGLEKNSTVEGLFNSMLPYQENRISRWIQSRNYKEISFKKSEFGEEIRIKPSSKKDKKSPIKDILEAIVSGNYYSIVITTRRGQKITIVRKEWMTRINI